MSTQKHQRNHSPVVISSDEEGSDSNDIDIVTLTSKITNISIQNSNDETNQYDDPLDNMIITVVNPDDYYNDDYDDYNDDNDDDDDRKQKHVSLSKQKTNIPSTKQKQSIQASSQQDRKITTNVHFQLLLCASLDSTLRFTPKQTNEIIEALDPYTIGFNRDLLHLLYVYTCSRVIRIYPKWKDEFDKNPSMPMSAYVKFDTEYLINIDPMELFLSYLQRLQDGDRSFLDAFQNYEQDEWIFFSFMLFHALVQDNTQWPSYHQYTKLQALLEKHFVNLHEDDQCCLRRLLVGVFRAILLRNDSKDYFAGKPSTTIIFNTIQVNHQEVHTMINTMTKQKYQNNENTNHQTRVIADLIPGKQYKPTTNLAYANHFTVNVPIPIFNQSQIGSIRNVIKFFKLNCSGIIPFIEEDLY